MQANTSTNPCRSLRSLKSALCVVALLLLSASCVTQRSVMRYLALHPLPADTVTVTDTQWRDTTVYVPMPADTVRDSIQVVLPCPDVPVTYKSDTVKAAGKYAKAEAWLEGDQLKIKLTMNEVKLAFTIDSIAATRTKTVTVTKQVTVEKRVIPPFYRAMLFVSIALFLMFVIIIFIALRR